MCTRKCSSPCGAKTRPTRELAIDLCRSNATGLQASPVSRILVKAEDKERKHACPWSDLNRLGKRNINKHKCEATQRTSCQARTPGQHQRELQEDPGNHQEGSVARHDRNWSGRARRAQRQLCQQSTNPRTCDPTTLCCRAEVQTAPRDTPRATRSDCWQPLQTQPATSRVRDRETALRAAPPGQS